MISPQKVHLNPSCSFIPQQPMKNHAGRSARLHAWSTYIIFVNIPEDSLNLREYRNIHTIEM